MAIQLQPSCHYSVMLTQWNLIGGLFTVSHAWPGLCMLYTTLLHICIASAPSLNCDHAVITFMQITFQELTYKRMHVWIHNYGVCVCVYQCICQASTTNTKGRFPINSPESQCWVIIDVCYFCWQHMGESPKISLDWSWSEQHIALLN